MHIYVLLYLTFCALIGISNSIHWIRLRNQIFGNQDYNNQPLPPTVWPHDTQTPQDQSFLSFEALPNLDFDDQMPQYQPGDYQLSDFEKTILNHRNQPGDYQLGDFEKTTWNHRNQPGDYQLSDFGRPWYI